MEGKIKIIERIRVIVGLILICAFPILVSITILLTLSQIDIIAVLKVMAFWFGTTGLGLIILPKFEIVKKEDDDSSILKRFKRRFVKSERTDEFLCKKCGDRFKSYHALGGHMGKHRKNR